MALFSKLYKVKIIPVNLMKNCPPLDGNYESNFPTGNKLAFNPGSLPFDIGIKFRL